MTKSMTEGAEWASDDEVSSATSKTKRTPQRLRKRKASAKVQVVAPRSPQRVAAPVRAAPVTAPAAPTVIRKDRGEQVVDFVLWLAGRTLHLSTYGLRVLFKQSLPWLLLLSILVIGISVALSYAKALLPSFGPLATLASLAGRVSVTPATQLYCSTIGIGCHREEEQFAVGDLAKNVATQASHAHDIFQSLVKLGNPKSMGLYHVESVAPCLSACTVLNVGAELGN